MTRPLLGIRCDVNRTEDSAGVEKREAIVALARPFIFRTILSRMRQQRHGRCATKNNELPLNNDKDAGRWQ